VFVSWLKSVGVAQPNADSPSLLSDRGVSIVKNKRERMAPSQISASLILATLSMTGWAGPIAAPYYYVLDVPAPPISCQGTGVSVECSIFSTAYRYEKSPSSFKPIDRYFALKRQD
jgi:hypothetical protein